MDGYFKTMTQNIREDQQRRQEPEIHYCKFEYAHHLRTCPKGHVDTYIVSNKIPNEIRYCNVCKLKFYSKVEILTQNLSLEYVNCVCDMNKITKLIHPHTFI